MISVIVPVYNCEAYLDESIQSLMQQTYFEHMEIIFIDDGSKDNSTKIISKYTEKHSNMRLIKQTNHGVSAARNRGIEAASGEYIAFFDADDIAERQLYEKLFKLIEDNDADMSCVNYSMCFDDGIIKVHKPKIKELLCGKEVIKSFLRSNVLCNNTIDKLFRSSIVKEIMFPTGYAIGEDMFFLFQYLLRIQRVAVDTTESLYRYCIRSNSAMKSTFSVKYFEPVTLSKKMLDMVYFDKQLFFYAEAKWIHETCKALALYYQSDSNEYSETITEYRKNLRAYSLGRAVKYLDTKHFIALLLMRISPKLYLVLYQALHIG